MIFGCIVEGLVGLLCIVLGILLWKKTDAIHSARLPLQKCKTKRHTGLHQTDRHRPDTDRCWDIDHRSP